MTFCGKCGYNNPEESRFCVNCGADLEESIETQTELKEEETAVKEETEEVERIGAYDPNKDYSIPPQQQPPAQQPPQQPYPPMYGAPLLKPTRGKIPVVTMYDPRGRKMGIMFSIAALAVSLITLFAIPMDFASLDNTIFRIGLMEGNTTVLVLVLLTLALAVIALLEPVFAAGTAICLIVTGYVMLKDNLVFFGAPEFAVVLLIALDVAALGIVAMVFMRKFVMNNIHETNLFKACYLAWTGIPHM
ncbi:hypothetical protein AUP07_0510 [methanogenic archaeon mixed culture ISO4-G1]|nr:hypothetical protein AUP07_0510 [methanogenic archaeon mixed culture ISO4-G1]